MHSLVPRALRLGFALAATFGSLCAELPRLGFTVGGAVPTGTSRAAYSRDAGVNLGLFADWEASPCHGLRLAYDGCYYPKRGDSSDGYDPKPHHAHSQALTLDYVYTPGGDFRGLHILAGAGATNIQVRTGSRIDETGVKLAWNAGIGLDFNEQWGLQTRYHSLSWEGHSLGSVTAGVTYRF